MRGSEAARHANSGGVGRAHAARGARRRGGLMVTTAVTVAGLVAAGALWVARPWVERAAEPVAASTAAQLRIPTGADSPPARAARMIHDEPSGWRHVLGRLDAIRSRAWLHQAPQLLRRVYVPGARVLRLDRAMLVGYQQRGLRVRGVHLTFESVRVRSRSPGRVRLDVVDTLGPMTALGRGGRQALPRDNPSRHVVVLARGAAGWRIAGIRSR